MGLQVSTQTSEVLSDVVRLHALNRIQAEAAWLMAEELLPVSAGKAVPNLIRCETDIKVNRRSFLRNGTTAAKASCGVAPGGLMASKPLMHYKFPRRGLELLNL